MFVSASIVIDCGRASVEFDIFQLNTNSHFAVTRNPIIWRLVGHIHDFLMGASYHVWVYQVIIRIKKTSWDWEQRRSRSLKGKWGARTRASEKRGTKKALRTSRALKTHVPSLSKGR